MLLKRAIKFSIAGGLTTAVAYIATMLFLSMMNYIPATILAWTVSVGVGFALNRRFTFGIVGPTRRLKELALFVLAALLQLLITLGNYSIMLGRLGFDPTVAFLINLAITTSFGFAFLNLVTFRRAR
ncbi:MAG: GtrA family protein [Caulobacteraceae bacterium]|nr:GtrA family protein [Caulobacteraceae bacterium]